MLVVWLQNFHNKKTSKEKEPCKSLSIKMLDSVITAKKKVLSSNIFGRMQILTKKDKNGEPYWWLFRKNTRLMRLVVKMMIMIMMNLKNKLLKAKKVF